MGRLGFHECAYLDDDSEDNSEALDVAIAEYEHVQHAAALRPRPDTTGLVGAGPWPYLIDDLSFHEMSSVLSSATDYASTSSSDPSLRGSDGLPADSVFFEMTEADCERS